MNAEGKKIWNSSPETFSRVFSDIDSTYDVDSIESSSSGKRRNEHVGDIGCMSNNDETVELKTLPSVGDLEDSSDSSETEKEALIPATNINKTTSDIIFYNQKQQLQPQLQQPRSHEVIDIYEFDEIDLDDGQHDTPEILSKFEDDTYTIEKKLSYGEYLLSTEKKKKRKAANANSIKPMNNDDGFGDEKTKIEMIERILLDSHESLSFLLKQNERLSAGHLIGMKTLRLRVTKCKSLGRLYFGLNRKMMYILEEQRDESIHKIRKWTNTMDSELAMKLNGVDIRSGIPESICKIFQSKRIHNMECYVVPFNQHIRQLSMKLSQFDERCLLLAKLVERQRHIDLFKIHDNHEQHGGVHEDSVSGSHNFHTVRNRSFIVPLKIMAVMFLIGIFLNYS